MQRARALQVSRSKQKLAAHRERIAERQRALAKCKQQSDETMERHIAAAERARQAQQKGTFETPLPLFGARNVTVDRSVLRQAEINADRVAQLEAAAAKQVKEHSEKVEQLEAALLASQAEASRLHLECALEIRKLREEQKLEIRKLCQEQELEVLLCFLF